MSPKKGASETFGTDIIFCPAHCGVIIQRLGLQAGLHDLDINSLIV